MTKEELALEAERLKYRIHLTRFEVEALETERRAVLARMQNIKDEVKK